MLYLRTWRLWAILAATVLAIAVATHFVRPKPIARAPRADNEYIDATLCAGCHARIYQTYRRTGMARSFYRPTPRNTVEDYANKNRYYHRASDTCYAMLQRDGKYYQRRWQIGFANQETNAEEFEIKFVMGSGNHVRTYLRDGSGGTLIELPLAWYPEQGGYWAMNPGYDTDHSITPRKIAYDCMFCHNAYPRVPAGHQDPGSEPVFSGAMPEGIDCQRCHGPGARHVRAAQVSGARPEDLRQSILNPARLSADRQMEVCMQCHLQTTSFPLPAAIRRFNRGPFSYRPGEPLAGFMLFFDQASRAAGKFEIVSSAYRLRQSQCYLQSKGALTCLKCHDPHDIPQGPDAMRHYDAACRQCHAAAFDTIVASGRHSTAINCVSCHMPKRRTVDVPYAVMTDHLIQRRKPSDNRLETNAPYRGEVVPYYPAPLPQSDENALYVAVAQVKHNSNLIPGAANLAAEIEKRNPKGPEFYFESGEAWRNSGNAAKAIAAYEEAVRLNPTFALALRRLGAALRESRQLPRAADVLNRAVQAAPQDARGWYELGMLDADQGRKSDSIAAFEKSAALDPDLPEAYNSLGKALADTGDLARAETAFRASLRVQPDSGEAQANLATLLASKGDLPEAAYHFAKALRATPNNATVRCNYAVALARMNRFDDAERQLEIAIKTDPNLPEAHDLLGSLLARRGSLDAAVRQFREALRIRPDFGPAAEHLKAAQ
jgi:tetratricopeptide (TPR) repeat protein